MNDFVTSPLTNLCTRSEKGRFSIYAAFGIPPI
jgi:hypothetical protein